MPLDMNRAKACEILGVSINDSLGKVRKAYQELSRRHHPDLNKTDKNANENFNLITQAYKYLADLYRDIIVEDDVDPPNQPLPNEVELNLTLEEMFNGCVKKQRVKRKIPNKTNGKADTEEVTIKVPVVPGILPSARIPIPQQGDRHIGNIPADVIFVVNELPHQHFKRVRFNLEYVAKISFEESCYLNQLSIPTLDKSKSLLSFPINTTVTSSTKIKIPGAGFPIPNETIKYGDLIVRFDIFCPQDPPVKHLTNLTLEQILYGYTKRFTIKRAIIGTKLFEEEQRAVEVKPGTEEGQCYTFPKCGDKKAGRTPADIIIIVRCKPHAYFKRKQVDIFHTINISASEANRGAVSFEIPTLDNKNLTLQIFETITAKTIERFPGYGLPHPGNSKQRGDLVVCFEIFNDTYVPIPIEHNFGLTLENVLHGFQKRITITRIIIDSDRNEFKIDKTITIDIRPGTKAGDKFRFPRIGNQNPNTPIPADVIFTATDRSHGIFKRRNFVDLEYISKLSKRILRFGGLIEIPTLDGQKLCISINVINDISDLLTATKTITGYGLPDFEDPSKRGDLLIRFTHL